jgi:hypothetical protein
MRHLLFSFSNYCSNFFQIIDYHKVTRHECSDVAVSTIQILKYFKILRDHIVLFTYLFKLANIDDKEATASVRFST